MLEVLLRGYLVYLSFVQPVIYGAQLCHSPSPDPLQVTNVTLTLIFAWLLEVADIILLSSFIAMRWLYLCARIVLALYFANPRLLGATQVYRKLFATLVDNYSPVINSIVVCHVETIGESGLMQYGAHVSTGLMRGLAAVASIAKTLLEASATTTVPAAQLPQRMSQARSNRVIPTTAVVEEEPRLNAARPLSPLMLFTPSPPPARPRPVQPPSLFSDADVSTAPRVAARGSDEILKASPEQNNPNDAEPSWSEGEDSSEPDVGLGVPNRIYREPETKVNRVRLTAYDPTPFDN